MVIDTRAFSTCSLGTLVSANINDDYIQGNGLIKTTGSVELSGIVVPEIGTAVTFSYIKDGQTYDIPRKLRVLSSFADPFRRTTQVELGCKLTYLQDLREPLKWKPANDPLNSGITAEDEEIITAPIFASSVMGRCLRKLGITASDNPLTNIFSIGEFDYSPGYVNVLSDLLISESYCGFLNKNEVLQIIDLKQGGQLTGPYLTMSDFIDISSINSGELPGEAVVVSFSTLKLKNSENGEIQTQDEKLENIDPALRSFVSWDRSENSSTELISLEYKGYNDLNTTIRYYNTIDYTEEIATYKELTIYKDVLVKPENEEDQTMDLPDEVQTQVDEIKRLVDKRITTSTQNLVKVAPTCVSQLLKFSIECGNGPIEKVTTDTYFYDLKGEKVFEISETKSSLIAAYAALDVPYLFESDISSGDDIIESGFKSVVRITNPNGSVSLQEFFVSLRYINPYTAQTFVSEKKTVETIKVGKVTKNITTEYVPFYSTAVGQQVTKEQKDGIRNAAQAMEYVRRMTVLTKSKTSISITGEEEAVQEAPNNSDVINSRNVDTNNASGTPDPNNGWRSESSTESTLAIGSFNAQRRREFSVPYSSDDYFQVGVLPGGGKMYSSSPSGAEAKARLFGRIQNKLFLGNRSGINIQALPGKIPSRPFSPFVVEANGLSALYRSNGYNWTLDANGIIASVDALFWGAVGGTGDFWFPVAPGITTLPETPPVVDGEITVDYIAPVWNETAILLGIVSTKAEVSSYPYASTGSTEISAITRTLANVADPYFLDPSLIVYSQSSVYSPNTAATVAGMQNGEFEEESETGTDSDTISWVQMDFGGTKRIKAVIIGCDFTSVLPGGWGPEYTENCDVEASFDGENWTYLFNTGSFTQGIQTYEVDILANYLRIVGSGYLAVTEFYALSVKGAEIQVPSTPSIEVAAVAPKRIGIPEVDALIPSANIAVGGIPPIMFTGSFVNVPSSSIAITTGQSYAGAPYDTDWTNVSALLHMDGANNSTVFLDSSSNGFTVTRYGDAKISTTQSKFGGASGYFDGSGDYLSIPNNAAFQFGTGDFTIEVWIYMTSTGDFGQKIIANGNNSFSGSGSSGAVYLEAQQNFNDRVLTFGTNESNPIVQTTTPIILNQWHHAAVTRSGSTVRLFMDGILVSTGTSSQSINLSNNDLLIGRSRWDAFGNYWRGYIDDLRITKGVARWTNDFPVPTEAYPNR